jgi:hypothetical protein
MADFCISPGTYVFQLASNLRLNMGILVFTTTIDIVWSYSHPTESVKKMVGFFLIKCRWLLWDLSLGIPVSVIFVPKLRLWHTI